jgi:hypothetical protein
MAKEKVIKDTANNRLKAIELLLTCCGGEDIEYNCLPKIIKKLPRKELEESLKTANKLLIDSYKLSHGFVSRCCKGKGRELMKALLKENNL